DGGYAAEGVEAAGQWRSDAGCHGEGKAAGRTEGAADGVGEHSRQRHIDPTRVGGGAIAADRVEGEAGAAPAQRHPDCRHHYDQQDQGVWYPGRERGLLRQVLEVERGAAARLLEDEQRDATP